ncbi:MAG: hybrid sensor histidine kinase/response regulator [Bacteroidota bacterium]
MKRSQQSSGDCLLEYAVAALCAALPGAQVTYQRVESTGTVTVTHSAPAEGRPVPVGQVGAAPLWQAADVAEAKELADEVREALLDQGVRALLVVRVEPVAPAGYLVAMAPRPRPWTPHEIQLMQDTVQVVQALCPATQRVQQELAQSRADVQHMREAKERAEELSALKSTFMANVSHEIRTPLTAIIGFASVLAEKVTGESRELVDYIALGGERLLHTINSVLDLSVLETGRVQLRPDPLDVVAEVRSQTQVLRSLAVAKDLRLHVHATSPSIWARLDLGALGRVLNNLIGNAIKFTTHGQVEVHIEETADHVRIRVEDTGRGIDATFVPHLFEAFQREEPPGDEGTPGSGLGLFITQQLVSQMDGEIDVSSEQGIGSVFTVTFPRMAPDELEAMERAQSQAVVLPGPATAPLILLVSESSVFHLLISQLLGPRYVVHGVHPADPFPDELGERPWRAVLVDLPLADDTDGARLVQRVRTQPGYDAVRLVAVTAEALGEVEQRLLASGYNAYLSKPFSRRQLQAVLVGNPPPPDS